MSRFGLTLRMFVALALAGCGGGFYISDGFDDDDPEVTLSTDTDTVEPGDRLRLVAVAHDDFSVSHVSFYRVQSGTRTLLGSDSTRPYELEVQVPSSATGTLEFVARAADFVGQVSQSDSVEVEVIR
jgi:hypothetical protein